MTGCFKSKLQPVQIEKVSITGEFLNGGSITVEASPKYELMSILCHLADYDDVKKESALMDVVNIWFDEYKDAAAVKLLREYHEKYGMNLDTAFSLLLCVSDDMASFSENLKEKPYYVDERWFEINTNKFLKAFNQFAVETKFAKFYLINKAFYLQSTKSIGDVMAKGNVTSWLESFYFRGQSQNVVIHTSEMLCDNYFWYSAAKKDGLLYVNCLPPIYEKQNDYHLVYRIAQNFITSKIDLIWTENGKFYSVLIDSILKMRGEKPADLSQKYSIIVGDLLNFELCDFMRRYSPDEIYQMYVDSLKQLATEELFEKFEEIINRYVIDKEKYPTYESFIPTETNWLFEFYSSLARGSALR